MLAPWGSHFGAKSVPKVFFFCACSVFGPCAMVALWAPKVAPKVPQGSPRDPKRHPKGAPGTPKKAPRGCPRDPTDTPYDPFCDSLLLSCCCLAYGLLFLASGLLVLAYRLMFFCSSVTGMLLTCPLAICVADLPPGNMCCSHISRFTKIGPAECAERLNNSTTQT